MMAEEERAGTLAESLGKHKGKNGKWRKNDACFFKALIVSSILFQQQNGIDLDATFLYVALLPA